jgi:hypothetical protein
MSTYFMLSLILYEVKMYFETFTGGESEFLMGLR